MDALQKKKLIGGIIRMVCQRIDESAEDILADYERAEKEAEKTVKFPVSLAVKLTRAGAKAVIDCRISWGVKRSSQDAWELPLDPDMFEAARVEVVPSSRQPAKCIIVTAPTCDERGKGLRTALMSAGFRRVSEGEEEVWEAPYSQAARAAMDALEDERGLIVERRTQ